MNSLIVTLSNGGFPQCVAAPAVRYPGAPTPVVAQTGVAPVRLVLELHKRVVVAPSASELHRSAAPVVQCVAALHTPDGAAVQFSRVPAAWVAPDALSVLALHKPAVLLAVEHRYLADHVVRSGEACYIPDVHAPADR